MNNKPHLPDITTIVYDFDNVFYKFHDVVNFSEVMHKFHVQSQLNTFGHLLNEEQAILISDSYKTYGERITTVKLFLNENVNDENLRQEYLNKFAELWHSCNYNEFSSSHPHIFGHLPRLIESFSATNHLNRGIASYSCSQNWSKPILSDMGIIEFFNEKAILGWNHCNFVPKNRAPDLVTLCFNALGVSDPNRPDCAFVEDSKGNLQVAKEHYPNLTTIYIHHGNALPQLPDYIDYQFNNLPEFHNKLLLA